MHRAASQWTRRRYPKQLDVLGRVWEYQKRGALHVHVVVGLETPIKRHAALAYQQRLTEIAPGYGFGFVQQKMSSARGQNAAAYVSSYFIEGHGRKASIRETVTSIDVPPHVVHVSTTLTQATGVTMRSLRRARYMHVIAQQFERGDLVVDLDTGELVPPRPTRYVLRT